MINFEKILSRKSASPPLLLLRRPAPTHTSTFFFNFLDSPSEGGNQTLEKSVCAGVGWVGGFQAMC